VHLSPKFAAALRGFSSIYWACVIAGSLICRTLMNLICLACIYGPGPCSCQISRPTLWCVRNSFSVVHKRPSGIQLIPESLLVVVGSQIITQRSITRWPPKLANQCSPLTGILCSRTEEKSFPRELCSITMCRCETSSIARCISIVAVTTLFSVGSATAY
jgi:hypothetical protein